MKKLTVPLVLFLLFPVVAQAQLLPWRRVQEQKHQDYERRLQALEQALSRDTNLYEVRGHELLRA